jgi:hypothetical protein
MGRPGTHRIDHIFERNEWVPLDTGKFQGKQMQVIIEWETVS